ncbi:helix-turn-helix domain-containing protein [Candidatus Stoquefichus sp. SB1]|uniref:helix-turn-helix domain-containing protein n=1 Tax=Candidatus Stoquefichus sp. SB1 TaxID=1658109 RepID=UPI00067F1765|nr:helix-turn-helix transcriptional regulator [Candidatus Stoquefichus sp. SB1]
MLIGEKIRELRVQNQLSQESVAYLLGVSRQSVSKWEQGLSKPSTDNLLRLSEIFLVSVEDLIDNDVQLKKEYESPDFFKEFLFRKKVMIPIIIFLGLFIVIFLCAIVMKGYHYETNVVNFIAGLSGFFMFCAYLVFLITILKYVYTDCKIRHIQPVGYVLFSITVIGFVFYLLIRDNISQVN